MSILIKQLEFNYPGTSTPVIKIDNWGLASHEKTFIHGASGCGKSTLLNILSGRLLAKSGSIDIFDHSLQNMKPSQLDGFRANHIGCVFQNFNLIPYLSAIENIKLASQFSKMPARSDAIIRLLNQLQLEEHILNKPTHQLSVGQKQRVAIARALINQPKLIIADEPTSSLDEKNRDAFLELLMEKVSELNSALIFVSHDLALSRHFSRVEPFQDINQMMGAL